MRTGLTHSEAGKLGFIKSRETVEKQKIEKIEEYNKNPSKCKKCGISLLYEKRKNNFCSNSCAASLNNLGSRKHGKSPNKCLMCGETTHSSRQKFCSLNCSIKFRNNKNIKEIDEKVKNNEHVGTSQLKKALIRFRGHKCQICGNTEWMGRPIPLVMDHENGNSEDNSLPNLRLVCGNCDMQLPTYKSKNRGNGRAWRRQRYAEGKSY